MNISEITTENNHSLEIILSGLYTKTIDEQTNIITIERIIYSAKSYLSDFKTDVILTQDKPLILNIN
jgi:hypothetical protein